MNKWILFTAAILATSPVFSQTERGIVSPLWEQPVRKSFKILPDPDSTMRIEPEDTGFWESVSDVGKKSKTAVFHFKNISAEFELNYMDNTRMMAVLDSIFSDFSILDQVDFIAITGASSPDGYTDRNENLAANRAMIMRNYILTKYPHVDRERIRYFSAGQYWDGLLQLVEKDSVTPSREAALRIIKSLQSGETRRRQLQQLSSRRTYNYLLKNTFPLLRVCAVHIILSDKEAMIDQEVLTGEVLTDETVLEEIIDLPELKTRQTVVPEPSTSYTVVPEPSTSYKVDQRFEKILLAVKTNMLFDVATALNLELELPFEDRWSLAGEYIFPWWLLKDKQYCLQLIAGSLEMRYWTGDRTNRPKMTGFFGGFFIGGGYYDLGFGDKGYQGEINIMTGLSGGYAHPVSQDGKWRMEYSLGLGYMSTDYREYKPKIGMDNEWHLILQKSGKQSYFGPLRAKISLVRTINRK